jgi:hypothetical protein
LWVVIGAENKKKLRGITRLEDSMVKTRERVKGGDITVFEKSQER